MRPSRFLLIALVIVGVSAFLLPLTVSAASWNAPYKLGDGDTKPSVAIDAAGTLHYVWWEPTHKVIQYAACAGLNKSDCTTPEPLPNNGGASYYPNLAIDPQGRPNVVWESRDGSSYSVFWARRENGSWTAPKKVSGEPYSELPDIAIGPQGIIHVVYQSKQNSTGYIYYVESSDGFGTFKIGELAQHQSDAPIETAAEAHQAEFALEGQQLTNGLFPRLTADANDRAHVVWSAPSPYGVYYRIQQANGDFGNQIAVSTGHKDQTPDIVFSSTGSVGITWSTYDNFNAGFAEYVNGKLDTKVLDIDDGLEQSLWARVAADCSGLFYFAFQGKPGASGSWDIFARTFNSNTNTFGKRVTIGNTSSQEQTPAIAVTNVGAIVYTNTNNKSTMGATYELGTTCGSRATLTPTDTTSASATPTPTDTVTSSIEHIAGDDPRIVYNGSWDDYHKKGASDKEYMRCGGEKKCKKHSSAALTFVGGTRVEWETAYAQAYGKAQIRIDGAFVEQVDLCKPNPNSLKPKFGVRTYGILGDANTPHNIEIRAMGKDSNCSTFDSNFVVVDGFNIVR